jgi:hypothetical protein
MSCSIFNKKELQEQHAPVSFGRITETLTLELAQAKLPFEILVPSHLPDGMNKGSFRWEFC